MELKDVILSTLAEMEEGASQERAAVPFNPAPTARDISESMDEQPAVTEKRPHAVSSSELIEEECRFLESVKERLLVLFEGFQSPNNTHIEAKVDLTLNFLEYLLSTIDSRIENIKKSGH